MAIRENSAPDWTLAQWRYDALGRKDAMWHATGVATYWNFDAAGRLSQLSQDLPGTADDLTLGFSYNPAGQIISRSVSNAAYNYTPAAGTVSYANNGRNQVTSVGGSAVTYDTKQNITGPPMGTYAYDSLNRMTSSTVSGASTNYTYDPAGRMFNMGTTRLLHDGVRPIAEYNASGVVMRRYIPGMAMDETIMAYEGAGTSSHRFYLSDERMSVTGITSGSGALVTRNTYDEYGQPGSGNAGLFQYTGQMWLPQAQAYHYKARVYAPQLGRFMQTDPIGYGDGANVYAYVGADPINWGDPSGLVRLRDLPNVPNCGAGRYFDRTWNMCMANNRDIPDIPGRDNPATGGSQGTSDSNDQDLGCRALRDNSERSSRNLPPSIRNTLRINSMDALRHDFVLTRRAHEDMPFVEAVAGGAKHVTGAIFGASVATKNVPVAIVSGVAHLAIWGNDALVAAEANRINLQMQALRDRDQYLNSCEEM